MSSIKKNMTQKIIKDIVPIIAEASSLKIESPSALRTATETLSRLNRNLDRVIEEKEKITTPLNQALKAERARWKPLETKLQEAIDTIRSKMTLYATEQTRLQKEQEASVAGRIKPGKGNFSLETGLQKLSEIEKAPESVETEAGTIKFRTDKRLKVLDESLIPRKYLVIDSKKLLEALKEGIEVPGATLEEVQIPINFRS
jgi:hypothetical protein